MSTGTILDDFMEPQSIAFYSVVLLALWIWNKIVYEQAMLNIEKDRKRIIKYICIAYSALSVIAGIVMFLITKNSKSIYVAIFGPLYVLCSIAVSACLAFPLLSWFFFVIDWILVSRVFCLIYKIDKSKRELLWDAKMDNAFKALFTGFLIVFLYFGFPAVILSSTILIMLP